MSEEITSSNNEESISEDSLNTRGKKRKRDNHAKEDDDLNEYVYVSDLLDENQNETKVSNRDLDAEKEIDELLGTEESVSSSEEDTQNEGEENDEDKDVVDEQKHSELLRAISSSLQTRPKKKQKIVEISSAREESEFNLRVGHLTQTPSNNEVTIESLVRPLQVGEAVGRKNAQHLLKVLKSTSHQLMTPPLSEPEKRRLTRNAAFDVVSQEVSEWVPTVQWLYRQQHLDFGKPLPFDLNRVSTKQGRVAPSNASLFNHTLSLTTLITDTLIQQQKDLRVKKSTHSKSNTSKKEPKTLEEEVQQILSDSLNDRDMESVSSQTSTHQQKSQREDHFTETNDQQRTDEEKSEDFSHSESLADELPPRQIDRRLLRLRQAQLAKMRSILFEQERKFKRMKKIKSKKYRQLRRKALEKAKAKLTLEELKEIDPEAAQREILKRERERALERVTLKHKNTSKWARYAAKSRNPSLKRELQEHYKIGEELRKKIDTMKDDDEESTSSSDDVELEDEEEVEMNLPSESTTQPDENTPEKFETEEEHFARLKQQQEEEKERLKSEGIFGMKFMKRAAERRQLEYENMLKEMDEEERQYQQKLLQNAMKYKTEHGIYPNVETQTETTTTTISTQPIEHSEFPGEQQAHKKESTNTENDDNDDGSDEDHKNTVTERSFQMSFKPKVLMINREDSLSTQETTQTKGRKSFSGQIQHIEKNEQKIMKEIEIVPTTQQVPGVVLGNSITFVVTSTPQSGSTITSENERSEKPKSALSVSLSDTTTHSMKSSDNGDTSNRSQKRSKNRSDEKSLEDDIQTEQQVISSENEDHCTQVNEEKLILNLTLPQLETHKSALPSHTLDADEEEDNTIKTSPNTTANNNNNSNSNNNTDHNQYNTSPTTHKHIIKPTPPKSIVNPWLLSDSIPSSHNRNNNNNNKNDSNNQNNNKQSSNKCIDEKDQKEKTPGNVSEIKEMDTNLNTTLAKTFTPQTAERLKNKKQRDNEIFTNLLIGKDSEQQQLINRAFAADDIEAEFAAEKEAELQDSLPEYLHDDNLKLHWMPGWGSWAGAGLEKKVEKLMKRKQEKLLEKKKKIQEKLRARREDKNLPHVIINHKRDRKLVRYTIAEPPFPFEDKTHYERSIRNPLGKEWNTSRIHKAIIRPKIKTRSGVHIEPLTRKIHTK